MPLPAAIRAPVLAGNVNRSATVSLALPSSKSQASVASVNDKVKVVVRVRPTLASEDKDACVEIHDNTARIANPKHKQESLTYTFDGCYDSGASQQKIFDNEVVPLLSHLFRGENASIFAYGMTGAGKTFTMQGGAGHLAGIIPRSVHYVFEQLYRVSNSANKSSEDLSVHMSCMEIYNEKAYDLLVPTEHELQIREDANHNIVVPNLAQVHLRNEREFDEYYATAAKNRSTAATKLNSASSRSHLVVLLKIQCPSSHNRSVLYSSKLYLIDLAGSEDNRRTDNVGIRLAESGGYFQTEATKFFLTDPIQIQLAINRSLFVLANVVDALNQKLTRIPYRDSKLTRMLQDSLGGNSHSLIITNIAGSTQFFLDTYNALSFAARARNISNKPLVTTQTPPEQEAKRKSDETDRENDKRRAQLMEWRMRGLKEKETKPAAFKEPFAPLQSQPLLSPMLRKHQVLDESTQSRLEALERRLAVSDTSAISGLLTPSTKEKTAKAHLQLALQLKQTNQLDAMNHLNQGLSLLVPEQRARAKREWEENNENQQTTASSLGKKRKSLQLNDELDSSFSTVSESPSEEWSNKEEEEPEEENTKPKKSTKRRSKKPKEEVSEPPSELRQSLERDTLAILNSGDVTKIRELNGVGKKRATQISDYLLSNGPFLQCADLKKIGFGDRMIQNILKGSLLKTITL